MMMDDDGFFQFGTSSTVPAGTSTSRYHTIPYLVLVWYWYGSSINSSRSSKVSSISTGGTTTVPYLRTTNTNTGGKAAASSSSC